MNDPITAPLDDLETGDLPSRKVSVVIPTYNNLSLLLECIESIRLQDYPRENVEILVIDNASSDRTQEVITERFPYVKLVRMGSNTGFAVACNRGAALASGDYIAFLNNDAVADTNWLTALFAALDSSSEGTVCVASRILSRDGTDTEFDGAASNLFGAGRPTSVWGWPDRPVPPGQAAPVLFASGGAMLIVREVFLDVGGFDPSYFAYFEDVDLGWRLWIYGYRVVYAPYAVVRHIGGATGKRAAAHRRYTLWESNALATIIKNYETGNMERVLTAALLLEYKRALMSTGDAFSTADYHLGGPPDTNTANVERLPRVSVSHLVAIDRLNSILPDLMAKRREIQARRVRPDSDIIPLMGRPFEPQYAGVPYADASRALASALRLYGLTASTSPNRVLILGNATETESIIDTANRLQGDALVAVALLTPGEEVSVEHRGGYTLHTIGVDNFRLARLISYADVLIVLPSAAQFEPIRSSGVPTVLLGSDIAGFTRAIRVSDVNDPRLLDICREPSANLI